MGTSSAVCTGENHACVHLTCLLYTLILTSKYSASAYELQNLPFEGHQTGGSLCMYALWAGTLTIYKACAIQLPFPQHTGTVCKNPVGAVVLSVR